jgi:hypothetical protein
LLSHSAVSVAVNVVGDVVGVPHSFAARARMSASKKHTRRACIIVAAGGAYQPIS